MKRIAVVFALLIVGLVILADMGRLPGFINFIIDEVPNGDRVGHFVLFGILNYLVVRAALRGFPQRPPLHVAMLTAFILALCVAAEEYSQNYFIERTADWIDLSASYAGMLLGGFLAFRSRGK